MAKPEYPSDKLDQYMVRFPEGMRERLKASAKEQGRSLNSEIVSRLQRYDSLGGEADAMWEVARALAGAIDDAVDQASDPLAIKIGDAFGAVDDGGRFDRTMLSLKFGNEAAKRLRGAIQLPAELLGRIKEKADESGRSERAEVIDRLDKSFTLERVRKALDEQRETFVQFLRAVAKEDRTAVDDILKAHNHFLAEFTRDDFWSQYVLPIAGIDDVDRLEFRVEEANRVAKQNGLDLLVEFEVDGNERAVTMRELGSKLRRMIMWDAEVTEE